MSIWYPYAQMKTANWPLKVISAQGVYLQLDDGPRLIDAISSWWCVIHGYNHPQLNEAITHQLGQMAHVMLGGLTHDPAEKLADKLVAITPEGLNHVFFGDSGSVGVEIAMKMAIQFWKNQGQTKKTTLLALEGSYHGDTCGAMSLCDPAGGMHALFAGLLPRQIFVPSPRGGFEASAQTVEEDLVQLEAVLQEQAPHLAAMIVEPIMQGVGGFRFYSPLYLQRARELCDAYEVLLIFDEIATGLGRTGRMFAADHARVTPDIMVVGKALTGGYLTLSATLATDRVFNAFYDDDAGKALMHGPTFMGNPLACAVSLQSIELFEQGDYLSRIRQIEAILRAGLLDLDGEAICEVRVLGACGVIEVYDKAALEGIANFAISRGVWLRPFDRYVYTVPPYVITESQLEQVVGVLRDWFTKKK